MPTTTTTATRTAIANTTIAMTATATTTLRAQPRSTDQSGRVAIAHAWDHCLEDWIKEYSEYVDALAYAPTDADTAQIDDNVEGGRMRRMRIRRFLGAHRGIRDCVATSAPQRYMIVM